MYYVVILLFSHAPGGKQCNRIAPVLIDRVHTVYNIVHCKIYFVDILFLLLSMTASVSSNKTTSHQQWFFTTVLAVSPSANSQASVLTRNSDTPPLTAITAMSCILLHEHVLRQVGINFFGPTLSCLEVTYC